MILRTNSVIFFIIFQISNTGCYFLGYCLYCVGISMFCWMSVLCFDLFYTFTRSSTSHAKKTLSRLVYYSIFSCGVPLIVTFFLYLVIDFVAIVIVVVVVVVVVDVDVVVLSKTSKLSTVIS
jgi:hypothetical protein